MLDNPKISIVISTFNSNSTLNQCLQSVFKQTYSHWELIVIDGASTDGTPHILSKYSSHISYWTSEPDHGIYEAWNKALKHVTGDWVHFLGSDDYFYNDAVLEKMANHLQQASSEDLVVYGDIELIRKDGQPLRMWSSPWEEVQTDFRNHMSIPHPACFHHRSLFDTYGSFDESFKIAGDYDFMLRVLLDKPPLYIPNFPVVSMREGGVSSNPKYEWLIHKENIQAHINNHLRSLPKGLSKKTFLQLEYLLYQASKYKPAIKHSLSSVFGKTNTQRLITLYKRLRGNS